MEKLRTAIAVGAATLAAATSMSATAPATPSPMGHKDIVQTAVAAGQFTTLVKLVTQAGLVGRALEAGRIDGGRADRRGPCEGAEGHAGRARQGQGAAEGRPAIPRRHGQGDGRADGKARACEDSRR